jgi:hypothetical protein
VTLYKRNQETSKITKCKKAQPGFSRIILLGFSKTLNGGKELKAQSSFGLLKTQKTWQALNIYIQNNQSSIPLGTQLVNEAKVLATS